MSIRIIPLCLRGMTPLQLRRVAEQLAILLSPLKGLPQYLVDKCTEILTLLEAHKAASTRKRANPMTGPLALSLAALATAYTRLLSGVNNRLADVDNAKVSQDAAVLKAIMVKHQKATGKRPVDIKSAKPIAADAKKKKTSSSMSANERLAMYVELLGELDLPQNAAIVASLNLGPELENLRSKKLAYDAVLAQKVGEIASSKMLPMRGETSDRLCLIADSLASEFNIKCSDMNDDTYTNAVEAINAIAISEQAVVQLRKTEAAKKKKKIEEQRIEDEKKKIQQKEVSKVDKEEETPQPDKAS